MSNTFTYDPKCRVCTRMAQWLARHSNATVVVPFDQFDHARHELTYEQINKEAWFFDKQGGVFHGTAAMGRALLHTNAPLKFLSWPFIVPPFSWLASASYPLLAWFTRKVDHR